jgi:DNA-binding winged helix-turn-helix (wHTH) protein/TolB-like protein
MNSERPHTPRLMDPQRGHLFEFGPFRLDCQERLLFRNGEPVALPPKTLDLLVVLVESHGHLLEKEELMKRLWPDSFVEEANLSHHVSILRKALGDGENGGAYIDTVPRRGYRFIGRTNESESDKNAGAVADSRSELLALLSDESRPSGQDINQPEAPKVRSKSMKLRGVATVLLGVAVVVIAVLFIRYREHPPASIEQKKIRSIAILPFSAIGLKASDEFLGLAMADALITRLGTIEGIIVRPTNEIHKYQGKQPDHVTVGREMRVDAVLNGSLQRSGNRTRLTVQLIRTINGRAVWAETFDQKAEDLFALEDSVSEAVARSLLLNLTAEQEKQLTQRETSDIEAYKLYVKGRYFADRMDLEKARECFEQAIKRDTNYALAYLGMAGTYYQSELPGKVRREKIAHWVSSALKIDDSSAEAHQSLATMKIFFDWDWAGAEAEIQRSLQLKPNRTAIHLIYARYWQALGRMDKATIEIRRAQDLDPISPKCLQSGAQISYCARDYDQAIRQSLMAIDLDPTYVTIHELLALSYELLEMYEKAMSAWRRVLTLSGRTLLMEKAEEIFSQRGYKRARQLMLQEELRRLKEESRQRFVLPTKLAMVYSALGDKEQTLMWLERCVEEKEWALFEIKTRPEFDHLRLEPRFTALIQRMGLPAELVLP